MYIIGCLWAFDYGHKKLKNYGKVSPVEFVLLVSMSLLSYFTLLGLVIGNYLKTNDKNEE
jgi:hypothetical protein